MHHSPELVCAARAAIGEGPCWDDRTSRLYWVDILGKAVHIFDPASRRDHLIPLDQQVGCLALRERGGVVVGLERGIYRLDLDAGEQTLLAAPETDRPRNRFNDGQCDAAGRLWIGSMSMDENDGAGRSAPAGSLYRLDPDGRITRLFGGVTISNGIAWSPDNQTMYYIDSPTRRVDAFDFNLAAGAITNRRTVITLPDDAGLPDGMAADAEGFLWIGQWGGWQIGRYDPRTGRCVQAIRLPVKNVTSCAFGGPTLEDLYITTARLGADENDPRQTEAGGLFCCRPGARGLPTRRFQG